MVALEGLQRGMLASLPESPEAWPPLPLIADRGKIEVTGSGPPDQTPEETGGSEWVEPRELPGSEDKGEPSLQAVEVFEMSNRQQNVARQIVLKMEGKGPYGMTTGKVDGHGVLRKVLPML